MKLNKKEKAILDEILRHEIEMMEARKDRELKSVIKTVKGIRRKVK